jgi:hypothetical protein
LPLPSPATIELLMATRKPSETFRITQFSILKAASRRPSYSNGLY